MYLLYLIEIYRLLYIIEGVGKIFEKKRYSFLCFFLNGCKPDTDTFIKKPKKGEEQTATFYEFVDNYTIIINASESKGGHLIVLSSYAAV